MTKTQAIELFGGVSRLAKALGIRRQSVYQWDENLKQRQIDEIRGAYLRIAEERDKLLVHTLEKG